MTKPLTDDNQLGAAESADHPSAHEAQRQRKYARSGEYQCQACQKQFMYKTGVPLACPNCKNQVSDTLVPIYTEDDPTSDEMMGRDEFSAGD